MLTTVTNCSCGFMAVAPENSSGLSAMLSGGDPVEAGDGIQDFDARQIVVSHESLENDQLQHQVTLGAVKHSVSVSVRQAAGRLAGLLDGLSTRSAYCA